MSFSFFLSSGCLDDAVHRYVPKTPFIKGLSHICETAPVQDTLDSLQ